VILSRRPSLAVRFLLAMILVASAGGATAAVVGLLVAPSLFHDHLHDALPTVSTPVLQEVDAAFWSANAIGVAFALPAALLASVAASYLLSRRLRRSTRPLAIAAAAVAGGRYDVRVRAAGLGPEFDELIRSFNDMAARLQRSEESRRRLLADVTHELRTPVATLAAYVEGLEDGIATLDAQTRSILRAQTMRLARLTDDMATVSLLDEHPLSLKLERTDPAQLVRAAVAAFADRFTDKGTVLTVSMDEILPAVDVDPERMGQVLTNLLDNALRHTPGGGSVTVSAQLVDGGVELAVTDTGEGIAPEHLDLIFDRFYRVDTARDRNGSRGSGIGLAIVKNLVDTHGGDIHARSQGPRHGSSFVIRLPAAT
jgi:signal transduction histidine kinase